mmetsp:Transcript_31227/g.88552  ORF Transcript_31227/g.88552 Transcript_31227/m.88552 type:complete len:426 (+) Transcript_31227:311-1588(+)
MSFDATGNAFRAGPSGPARPSVQRVRSAGDVNRSQPGATSAKRQSWQSSSRSKDERHRLYLQSNDVISKAPLWNQGHWERCTPGVVVGRRSVKLLFGLCVLWGVWTVSPWMYGHGSLSATSLHIARGYPQGPESLLDAEGLYHLARSHRRTSAAAPIANDASTQVAPLEKETGSSSIAPTQLSKPYPGIHTVASLLNRTQHPRGPAVLKQFNITAYLNSRLPEVAKQQRPYKCVSWRQTGNCDANGPREAENDKACHEKIPTGTSGYCEVIEEGSGELRRVMQMNCTSHPNSVVIHGIVSCDQAGEFAMFPQQSLEYRPPNALRGREEHEIADPHSRGIVFCVADSLMVSAYAAIRNLRRLGCQLPVELWYLPDELQHKPGVVKDLIYNFQVSLRPIAVDRRLLCHGKGQDKCFNAKIYSIYHTR